MTRSVNRQKLPCCHRPAEIGEYLVANDDGPCCLGCWLSDDLAKQGGDQVVVDALKGEPFVLPPPKVKAVKRSGGQMRHEKPHPDHDCRGCGTPLVRESKLVAHANQCPDCGEIICIPCLTDGKVKCRTGKNARN